MYIQDIQRILGKQMADGFLSIRGLRILVLGGNLCKSAAMLAVEMVMLYKRCVVTHAMAGGVCPILPHRSIRQLMSSEVWLMLLAADGEVVMCQESHKALRKSVVHHAMAWGVCSRMLDVLDVMAVGQFIDRELGLLVFLMVCCVVRMRF